MFNFFKHTKQFVLFVAAVRGQLEGMLTRTTNKNLNSKSEENNLCTPHIWNPSNLDSAYTVRKCTKQLVLKTIQVKFDGGEANDLDRDRLTSKLRLFVMHLTQSIINKNRLFRNDSFPQSLSLYK